MLGNNVKRLVNLGCCALCCLAAAAAFAAPPGAGKPSRNAASRLDLRPPDSVPAEREFAPMEGAAPAFPSAKRMQLSAGSRLEDDLPALGSGAALSRESRAEAVVRRVQREGVPLARLYENRYALLHIGLSPRGKPGLWLIQKVP